MPIAWCYKRRVPVSACLPSLKLMVQKLHEYREIIELSRLGLFDEASLNTD